jgi:beta-lactamase superfamily II metal-dependent hydrolase
MTDLFRVEMLAAREGDCLLVTYGDHQRPHRILIDGGRAATYPELKQRFAGLPDEQRTFELLVVTHVDRDHIEGALALLQDPEAPVRFKDIWFNGYDHLRDPDLEVFGAVQGEQLTTTLLERDLPWNEAFGRRSVELRADTPAIVLAGGLTLRVLSPDRQKLAALIPRWERECRHAGLLPGAAARRLPAPEGFERMGAVNIARLAQEPFVPDGGAPNGSSIAVLAEYAGRRALLAADAHADRLVDAIRPLAEADGGQLRVDAVKLPHHGSQHNISAQLLGLMSCPRYLVSSNGAYFDLPDPVAISRVITFGGEEPELLFNYRSPEALLWQNRNWQRRFGYRTQYPAADNDGVISVDL